MVRPRKAGKYHTPDNRFQVDRQSIGSYSDRRRPSVARDRYRWVLFSVAYWGQEWAYRLASSNIYFWPNSLLYLYIYI